MLILMFILQVSGANAAPVRNQVLQKEFQKSEVATPSELTGAKEWKCEKTSTKTGLTTTENYSFTEMNGQIINRSSSPGKLFSHEEDGLVSLDLIEGKSTVLLFRKSSAQELLGEVSVPSAPGVPHKKLPNSMISKQLTVLSYLKCKKAL